MLNELKCLLPLGDFYKVRINLEAVIQEQHLLYFVFGLRAAQWPVILVLSFLIGGLHSGHFQDILGKIMFLEIRRPLSLLTHGVFSG